MKFHRNVDFIVALICITTFSQCEADDIPATIDRCKYDDTQCLLRTWNKYIKSTSNPNGLPEFDLPNLSNYFIAKESISPGNGPLDIVLKMRDFNLTGLHTVVLDSISGFKKDPKEMTKFEVTGHAPLVGIRGKYNVKGKVLLLPVAGDDEGEVKFYNIKYNVTAFTSTKMIDGKEFLVITKVQCSYITERNHYRFENILNNKEISDSINNILNENQDIINNEVRGPIGKILGKLFKMFLETAFKKYPYSSLFL